MNVLSDLKERGLVYQAANLKDLEKKLSKEKIVLYCGFDPTGRSLHLGHLLQLLTLKRFLNNGHRVIVLLGGATGLIGDPSGKSEERPLLTKKELSKNKKKIKEQIEKILINGKGKKKVLILDNYWWHSKFKFLDFLREVGKHFTISYLLAKESVKNRLEAGISFTEFSYNLLQAYDFYHLFKNYHCELQIGGSDQWGNITSGIDLIKKLENKEVYGFTLPLITSSTGEKFGKSSGKALWLDKRLTTPYELYQYFFNIPDSEVIKFLKYFTFLKEVEIDKLEKETRNQPEKRIAQKILAFEAVKLIHSEKEAKEAKKISEALFYGKIKNLTEKEFKIAFKGLKASIIKGKKKISLVDILILSGASFSKRQARQDIENGIIFINDLQFTNIESIIEKKFCLFKKYLLIKRGKKNYFLVKWL
ncbi:MAG TPA: tyrosine--tRNA ligase [Candidatus Paceibacterota bacterium]|nr:tyrosine--tRNA ligase [Candidatus Paceibacterota bacterium]